MTSELPESAKSIGDIMKKMRKERKIPMRELAEITGMSHGHLTMIENGKSSCTLRSLEKIAAALGTSAAALLSAASRAEAPDTEYLKQIVASNLRQAREGRCLSRRQLAEPIGFIPQYIGTTELAKRLPNVRNIVRLAQGLQIQPSELLKETFDPNCLEAPRVYEHITLEILAARLKQGRHEQCLTRKEVGVGTSISDTILYLLESGKSWSTVPKLMSICNYYGCPASKFLDL